VHKTQQGRPTGNKSCVFHWNKWKSLGGELNPESPHFIACVFG